MILKHINDIAAICAGHGIETAIISPGSRSAPITLAFNEHPAIDVKVVADERSAAFIAIGMAQQQKKPVVLVCTSGSAVYNYAPAVAEAFYQEVPLLILSADRPPEWTNQYDGQTIQQSGIFGKHVKGSYQFPTEAKHSDDLWFSNRITNEAILSSDKHPKGPVHINIPLREPFYPTDNEAISFDSETRIISNTQIERTINDSEWASLTQKFEQSSKRLVVVGQLEASESLNESLDKFSHDTNTIIINDIIGNQHQRINAIQHQDAFLQPSKFEALVHLSPDLLITIGKSLISKNLKIFLRDNPPTHHWHIHPADQVNDTLKHLTKSIKVEPQYFFHQLGKRSTASSDTDFNEKWLSLENEARLKSSAFFENCQFGEFQGVNVCLKALPTHSQLHLANSMTVRYANLIGLSQEIEVFSNRGTSGIDGSNGTAVGAALAQNKLVTLITGDMAFFYDRNAFWHDGDLRNLRIIVLNNHGGGIFRMINGPKEQADYTKLFETHQPLNAKNTADDFGFEYHSRNDISGLGKLLQSFFNQNEKPKLLEIFSESEKNTEIFEEFKTQFKA